MIVASNERPVERVMDTAFTRIRNLVDADTVMGTPVTTANGVSIIPISRVSMGFLTGGGEYGEVADAEFPFAGGSGAGVSVKPLGFLIANGDSVKLVNMDDKNPLDKFLDFIPDVIESLRIKGKGRK